MARSLFLRLFVAAAAALLLWAGCSTGPDEAQTLLDLFDRIAMLRIQYIDALDSKDPLRVQSEAARLVRVVGPNYSRVAPEVSSADPERQEHAAFALGFSQNRAAIGLLVGATQSALSGVRVHAIAALGMLGFDEVPTEPFARLLEDPAWEVRHAALFGLRYLLAERNPRGMLEAVHKKVTDPVMGVRNDALIVLQKVKSKESVDVLLSKPIKDSEWLVRYNAALALGMIGREAIRANPHLIEMLRDEDTKVVEAAWSALNRINERDFDRSYATWRDWYEDEQRHTYVCPEHKEVTESSPGECKKCGKKLERIPRETGKRSEPAAALYVCPDHAEVLVTSPSKCAKPGCGKELVPKKVEVTYVCPDHPEILTTTPAKCGKPGCGKELVPKK